jgi:hypothetical protein
MSLEITSISPTECIGNSLNTINTNFGNLQQRVLDVNASLTKLINDLSLVVTEQRTSTGSSVVFLPVNSGTQSNRTVVLQDRNSNQTTTPSLRNSRLKVRPWWSPNFKVGNIPGLPKNCNCILVHAFVNTNSVENNALTLFIKERNAAIGNTVTPTAAEAARYHAKMFLDPTGGKGAAFEAESDATFLIYLDNDRSFSWRLRDGRQIISARQPFYQVRFTLLGYFVPISFLLPR